MNPLNQQVCETLTAQSGDLIAQIVAREFARHPELEQRYGKAGREKCLQDTGYHLSYLTQAIAQDEPALFGNYIGWAKVMLAKRGVPAKDLEGLLESMKDSLTAELAPDISRHACRYLDGALEQMSQIPADIPSFIVVDSPLADLAREYLQALLAGKRHAANQLILDAVQQGITVRELYLNVFERTQHEIGRLWQVNEISVAQEHYCTAATQLIISQLYPYIFDAPKTRGMLVSTCVSGDQHELGARMVSDFFEMDGWNTHYLGANMPTSSVVQTLTEQGANVLAISATISSHVGAVESLIASVRRAPGCANVKIIVGGYPFKIAPQLWEKIGADGSADNAHAAVALGNRLANFPVAA